MTRPDKLSGLINVLKILMIILAGSGIFANELVRSHPVHKEFGGVKGMPF